MSETVKVSIIMGIYNCEATLSETLNSIRTQSYQNWELIMCDDGSTDKTYMVAERLASQDRRILLLKNSENLGLAKTLNKCLVEASGEFVMRHDGDDIMMHDRISKQVKFMLTNECDASGSGAVLFDETGNWGIRQPIANPSPNIMAISAPFIHPTVIFKKEVLLAVDGYSDNKLTKRRLEDYDLWIKLFEKGCTLLNIQEALIYFREDRNSFYRKKKLFRLFETKARLIACRRLKIPYFMRILAFKPLLAMLIPNGIMRHYHLRKNRSIVHGANP